MLDFLLVIVNIKLNYRKHQNIWIIAIAGHLKTWRICIEADTVTTPEYSSAAVIIDQL